MRKGVLWVWLFFVLPVISGCWSRVEVNDLAFVTAVGIDKMEDGKIRLALQLAVPRMLGPASGQGGGGGEKGIGAKAAWIVSEKGTTIMDAYRRLQEKLPRKVFFSHSRIFIIGEKLARNGVSEELDFFTRNREARMGSYIVFTKGDALDILQFIPKFEKVSAEVMREEVRTGLKVNLKDFVDMLVAEGIEPIAPQMEIVPSNLKRGEKVPIKQSPSKVETNLSVLGTALFKKDRLIGWMDDRETRGVMWLRQAMKTGVATVSIPKDKGKGLASLQLVKAESRITPAFKGNELHMEVKIEAEYDLYENSSKMNLGDPSSVEWVETELEKEIKERVQMAVDKVQTEFKSDILGFGRAVHRKYPKEWENQYKKQWDKKFPELEVAITVDAEIDRVGLSNKSLIWEEKEFQQ